MNFLKTEKIILTGQIFFALGFIGLGIKHFTLNDFITGRAPALPENPAGLIWAYLTGAFFILIGLGIIFRKKIRPAAIIAALIILIWAFFRQLPSLFEDSFLGGVWTQAGKALVCFGGLLTVAGSFPKEEYSYKILPSKILNINYEFFLIGKTALGLFFILAGIQHFLFTDFVAALFPEWFPGDHIFWTYFGAICLIAGGLGILIPYTASIASLLSGIMLFSWFWIIHIPRTYFSRSDGVAVFEALAFSGIALVLAGVLKKSVSK